MHIQFDLKELDGTELPQEKIDQLKTSLGISDEDNVDNRISKLAQAATFEYIQMLVGSGMPNRADEAKQDRLFFVIKKVFTPDLPTEDEISVMFQLTKTQSRTLLRNTLSRYRTKLSKELNHTLKKIFRRAVEGEGNWNVNIDSVVLFEHLNFIVAKEGAEYNPIRKSPVGIRKYLIPLDTHTALENHFAV